MGYEAEVNGIETTGTHTKGSLYPGIDPSPNQRELQKGSVNVFSFEFRVLILPIVEEQTHMEYCGIISCR